MSDNKPLVLLAITRFSPSKRGLRLLIKYPCCGAEREVNGHYVMESDMKHRRGGEIRCRECGWAAGREKKIGKPQKQPGYKRSLFMPAWSPEEAGVARALADFTKLMYEVNHGKAS